MCVCVHVCVSESEEGDEMETNVGLLAPHSSPCSFSLLCSLTLSPLPLYCCLCLPPGLRKLLPSASDECVALLEGLLEYDPEARLSARHALKHPYFKELRAEDKRRAKAMAAEREEAAEERADAAVQSTSRRMASISLKPGVYVCCCVCCVEERERSGEREREMEMERGERAV